MDNEIKFTYDWQTQDLASSVGRAFLLYCVLKNAYPKVVVIAPVCSAGYANMMLETRVDKNLEPGTFRLGEL